jgi:hypothetical protein
MRTQGKSLTEVYSAHHDSNSATTCCHGAHHAVLLLAHPFDRFYLHKQTSYSRAYMHTHEHTRTNTRMNTHPCRRTHPHPSMLVNIHTFTKSTYHRAGRSSQGQRLPIHNHKQRHNEGEQSCYRSSHVGQPIHVRIIRLRLQSCKRNQSHNSLTI